MGLFEKGALGTKITRGHVGIVRSRGRIAAGPGMQKISVRISSSRGPVRMKGEADRVAQMAAGHVQSRRTDGKMGGSKNQGAEGPRIPIT